MEILHLFMRISDDDKGSFLMTRCPGCKELIDFPFPITEGLKSSTATCAECEMTFEAIAHFKRNKLIYFGITKQNEEKSNDNPTDTDSHHGNTDSP